MLRAKIDAQMTVEPRLGTELMSEATFKLKCGFRYLLNHFDCDPSSPMRHLHVFELHTHLLESLEYWQLWMARY